MTTSELRIAAYLLVAGWLVFWAGAFTPPWRWWYGIPTDEYLQMISAHRVVWRWIAAAFATGVVCTALGLTALRSALQGHDGSVWSDLGLTLFAIGSVVWLASIAFRATATVSAAEAITTSGTVPEWFVPLRGWSGALFGIYMVLAYVAVAAFGKALLASGIVPAWLAWAHIVFGLVGAVGFVARVPVFDPPLMIHLLPGILGVVLLIRPPG